MSSTREGVRQPALGGLGWARWAWRSLTSMRTALLLLLLLAVAAVPGSIWPQRSIDASRTSDYIAQHPTAGPWLDRFGFFEVYASPWFAAIYLLLLISLVGCIIPRSRLHLRALRATPPRAPRHLDRLSASSSFAVAGTPPQVLDRAREALRTKRYRVHSHDADSVSAESGYLRETGNLVFHTSVVLVIVGMAIGHLFGWKGDVIVPAGGGFANTLIRYDTFAPGPWVRTDALHPFTLDVERVDARFEDRVTGKGQYGMPRDFTAHVAVREEPGASTRGATIKVNHPLELPGATVFLLGNGYAPHLTVRDASGQVVYAESTPFLTQDKNYKSVGAVKVEGAGKGGSGLGFTGFFLPTAAILPETGPTSIYPDAKRPAMALTLFEGDLYPGGRPQSVYTLDTAAMRQVSDSKGEPVRLWLEPGTPVQLPGGRGSITLDGVDRFAGLSIRQDPGKWLTLGAALAALAGLVATLVVPRRRVFVRVLADPAAEGTTLVTVGGLAKGDDQSMPAVLDELRERVLAVRPPAAGTTVQ